MNEEFHFVELDDAGFQMVLRDKEIYHKFMEGLSCIHDLVADHPRLAVLYIETEMKSLLDGALPEPIKQNLAKNYETAQTIHGHNSEIEKDEAKDFIESLSRWYTGLRLVEKDW